MGVTLGSTYISTQLVGFNMDILKTNKDSKDGAKEDGKEGQRYREDGSRIGTTGDSQLKKRLMLRMEIDGAKSRSAPASPTGNYSTPDLTWDEEQARSVKKARRESTEGAREVQQGTSGLATKIRRTIKKLDSESRLIMEFVRERNTKREIKEIAGSIRSLVSQLVTEESQTLLQTMGSKMKTDEAMEGEESYETMAKRVEELEEEKKKLEKMVGELTKQNKKLLTKVGEFGEVTEEMFRNNDCYEDFIVMEGRSWPNDIYKAAYVAEGSPLKANKDTDIVVLSEEDTTGENEEIGKGFRDRYPEMEEIEGRVGAITVTTRVTNKERKTNERERWIYKVMVDDGGKEGFNNLKKLKETAKKGGRVKMAFYPPGDDTHGEKTRKMIEYIFRNSGIKCLVYTKVV